MDRPVYPAQAMTPSYAPGSGARIINEHLAAAPIDVSEPLARKSSNTQRVSAQHASRRSPPGRRDHRFIVSPAIGGSVFLAGFAFQATLTSGVPVPPIVSYILPAVTSLEVGFLLNRWLTWRDRDTPFWAAFGRYNLQKTITVALNLAAYYGLLGTGMNYLVARLSKNGDVPTNTSTVSM